ncbi:gastrin-releasing peptide receptor-like [Lytechinus variegatus]|uniref:gastrin-releasing peptide receptor-like n=1 Tax=Lytechinus variegatus TaxID=7654 RepID=UPI001BB298C2|nr:gastrin-releasing peptide receptor-like [Lytechinus variegatus]
MNESIPFGSVNMTDDASNMISYPPSEIYQLILSLLAAAYNIAALIGNLLIIRVVPKIPHDSMHDSSKACLISQAIADSILATTIAIGTLSETIGSYAGWTYGRLTFCRVVGFVPTALVGVSIWLIALLNIDRYAFIVRPMLYSRLATRNLTISLSLFLSVSHTSLLLLFVFINDDSVQIIKIIPGLTCVIDFQDPIFLPFSYVIFGMPWMVFVALLGMYFHIVKISLSQLKRIRPLQRPDLSLETSRNRKSTQPAEEMVAAARDVKKASNIPGEMIVGDIEIPEGAMVSKGAIIEGTSNIRGKEFKREVNSDDSPKTHIAIIFNGQCCKNEDKTAILDIPSDQIRTPPTAERPHLNDNKSLLLQAHLGVMVSNNQYCRHLMTFRTDGGILQRNLPGCLPCEKTYEFCEPLSSSHSVSSSLFSL